MNLTTGRNEHLGSEGGRGEIRASGLGNNNDTIRYGIVTEVSIDGSTRLRVRIDGIDDGLPKRNPTTGEVTNISWAHGLLPKMFHIYPRVGDTVKILFTNPKNTDVGRLWLGPVVPTIDAVNSTNSFTALAGREGGKVNLGRTLNTIVEAQDLYPEGDDVGVMGRDNSDILLRKEEVLIRVGKHVIDNPLKKNNINPGYINMRLLKPSDFKNPESTNSTEKQLNISNDRTDTVLMGNKLFLIGRDSNSSVVKPWLTKEDHLELEGKLHPIVYGDVLYEFMTILREWIKSHIHEGGGVAATPPDKSGKTVELEEWFRQNLDQRLLSKNIYAGGDVPTKTNNQT